MSSRKGLSLLLMAAGMGSRYGGIKQVEGFGPNGETIMDYSIYDALNAGFDNIVFVVREEILDTVREMFLRKLRNRAEVHFEVQSLDRFLPAEIKAPQRKKPWGTAHAMLCGSPVIKGPFAVINADDFYGREAFHSLASFLVTAPENHHAMVGYVLKEVLSSHGSVSRGLVQVIDADGYLNELAEAKNIISENGWIISRENSGDRELPPSLLVSMNCWAFNQGIFEFAENEFADFARRNSNNPTAEFYIADLVTQLIQHGLGKVQVIKGGENWMGVTYKEDKDEVCARLRHLMEGGVYPNKLW